MPHVHTLRIPATLATSHMGLRVKMTGLRTFRARIWLASWVFRFGGWVAGLKTEIEIE